MMPNQALLVDTPTARLFHIVHPWRRAADVQRSAWVL